MRRVRALVERAVAPGVRDDAAALRDQLADTDRRLAALTAAVESLQARLDEMQAVYEQARDDAPVVRNLVDSCAASLRGLRRDLQAVEARLGHDASPRPAASVTP